MIFLPKVLTGRAAGFIPAVRTAGINPAARSLIALALSISQAENEEEKLPRILENDEKTGE
jgi:flavin-dependent dehydrogenase